MTKNMKNTRELVGFSEIRTKDGWFSIIWEETYSDSYVVARSEEDYRDAEHYEIEVDEVLEAV